MKRLFVLTILRLSRLLANVSEALCDYAERLLDG